MSDNYPHRIVCLTEETTETLYLLGEGDRVVGISGYTVRPPEAPEQAQGVGVHQRPLRQDRRAEAGPDSRLLGSAGRHRRRADSARLPGDDVQPAEHRGNPADDPDRRRARRPAGRRGGPGRVARARAAGHPAARGFAAPPSARVLRGVGRAADFRDLLGGRADRDRRRRADLSGAAPRVAGEGPDRRARRTCWRKIPRSSSRRGAARR